MLHHRGPGFVTRSVAGLSERVVSNIHASLPHTQRHVEPTVTEIGWSSVELVSDRSLSLGSVLVLVKIKDPSWWDGRSRSQASPSQHSKETKWNKGNSARHRVVLLLTFNVY